MTMTRYYYVVDLKKMSCLYFNCKYLSWTNIIRRYIVIFLASKLFNFAPSLLFLRISDNFSTGPE